MLVSGAFRRLPRLYIPSTAALLLYYAMIHFTPWYGYNECHQVGDSTGDASDFNVGYALENTIGQYLWQQALYTIQWTMQVEWVMSLVVYFLAYAITRPRMPGIGRAVTHAILMLLLPICWLATDGGVPRPVQYLQPFLFGLALCDADASGRLEWLRSRDRTWLGRTIHIALLLLVIYFGSYPVFNTDVVDGAGTLWAPFGWEFGWLWISVGGGLLLLVVLTSKEAQTFLHWRPVYFLGRISFGFYLVHYIVLCALDATLLQWMAPSMTRDGAAVFLLLFFAIPITMLVAWGFYLAVDAPAVTLSHMLYDWFVRLLRGRSAHCGCCNLKGNATSALVHSGSAVAEAIDDPAKPHQGSDDAKKAVLSRRSASILASIFVVLVVVSCIPRMNSAYCHAPS
jgi:peptidoglycan/LPS O-acetylase OafA/YrhL